MRIYIAGPYSASTWEEVQVNTDKAVWAGVQVMNKGHIPFVPHLCHYMDELARDNEIEIGWDEWLLYDFQWLDLCDAILFLAPSRGANLELVRATERGMKVFYSIEEIPRKWEEKK